MRVYTKRILREFWERHPDAESALTDWYRATLRASWHTAAEVRAGSGNARILSHNRAIFNIKGNNYRLVVRIDYQYQVVYIRFVGTHAEYNRINALEI